MGYNKPLDDDAGIIKQGMENHMSMMAKLSDKPFILHCTKEEFEKEANKHAPSEERIEELKQYAQKYGKGVYHVTVNERTKDAPVISQEALEEYIKSVDKYRLHDNHTNLKLFFIIFTYKDNTTKYLFKVSTNKEKVKKWILSDVCRIKNWVAYDIQLIDKIDEREVKII